MDLKELISQLDEVKFARLLRHLQDNRPHQVSGQITIPSFPVDIPGSQLLICLVGRLSSRETYLGSWAFQIAKLPIGIGTSPRIVDILLLELEVCLRQLAQLKDPLGTLLGADCGHAYQEVMGRPEGCDYHLIANVPVGRPQEFLQEFHDRAKDMLQSMLVAPAWYPRFGLGTPETISAQCPAEARRFIIDLLRSPSGYQFVAREGRISVSAFSQHGLYLAHGAGRLAATTAAMAAATATVPVSGDSSALVGELEQLINDPKVKEADIQRLFEERPSLLRLINPNYGDIVRTFASRNPVVISLSPTSWPGSRELTFGILLSSNCQGIP